MHYSQNASQIEPFREHRHFCSYFLETNRV